MSSFHESIHLNEEMKTHIKGKLTTALDTFGCCSKTFSNSLGKKFKPPLDIISCIMTKKWKQPIRNNVHIHLAKPVSLTNLVAVSSSRWLSISNKWITPYASWCTIYWHHWWTTLFRNLLGCTSWESATQTISIKLILWSIFHTENLWMHS